MNVYVSNLHEAITDSILKDIFRRYGTVTDYRVMRLPPAPDSKGILQARGTSKGFGFVYFSSAESAARAVAEMNGKEVYGKQLYVNFHVRREQRLQAQGLSSQPIQMIIPQIANMSLDQQKQHTSPQLGALPPPSAPVPQGSEASPVTRSEVDTMKLMLQWAQQQRKGLNELIADAELSAEQAVDLHQIGLKTLVGVYCSLGENFSWAMFRREMSAMNVSPLVTNKVLLALQTWKEIAEDNPASVSTSSPLPAAESPPVAALAPAVPLVHLPSPAPAATAVTATVAAMHQPAANSYSYKSSPPLGPATPALVPTAAPFAPAPITAPILAPVTVAAFNSNNNSSNNTCPIGRVYVVDVSNISATVSDERFVELFKPYGTITSYRIVREPLADTADAGTAVNAGEKGPPPNGYGFVCYSTADEAVSAVAGLNGQPVDGVAMSVCLHLRKVARPAASASAAVKQLPIAPPIASPALAAPSLPSTSAPQELQYYNPPTPPPAEMFSDNNWNSGNSYGYYEDSFNSSYNERAGPPPSGFHSNTMLGSNVHLASGLRVQYGPGYRPYNDHGGRGGGYAGNNVGGYDDRGAIGMGQGMMGQGGMGGGRSKTRRGTRGAKRNNKKNDEHMFTTPNVPPTDGGSSLDGGGGFFSFLDELPEAKY